MLFNNRFIKFGIDLKLKVIELYVKDKQLNQKKYDITNEGKTTGITLKTTSPESSG